MKKFFIIPAIFLLSSCTIAPQKSEHEKISMGFYASSIPKKISIEYSTGSLPKKISYTIEKNEDGDFKITSLQVFGCNNTDYNIDKIQLSKISDTFFGIKTTSRAEYKKTCNINDIEIDIITHVRSANDDDKKTKLAHNFIYFKDGRSNINYK